MNVHFHRSNPDQYGIMPIGSRRFRVATIPEVVRFQTCNAAGPYSAVNTGVPPWVPLWQYVDPQERAASDRSQRGVSH